VSSESNNIHRGFFARIIRDALCTLPDVNGEREPLALEQQLQAVVEYSASAMPINPPTNIHAQISAQTPDAMAASTVSHSIALQNSLSPVSSARNLINTEVTSSLTADQYSMSAAVSETSSVQTADKTAAHFPRNNRAMAQQQPQKKIPLAITMRDARTPKDHRLAPIVQRAESAPVQTVVATAPAVDGFPERLTGNPELTKVETARVNSNRQRLKDALPVIAESAPVFAVHHQSERPLFEHQIPERKAPPPALRIGAVTIRVVDATPESAVSSRASKPTTHSIAIDPIASAESRHFLRTL
jgi:hypothetical protein